MVDFTEGNHLLIVPLKSENGKKSHSLVHLQYLIDFYHNKNAHSRH